MSWNITGTGTKAALKKEIGKYFDSLISSNKGTPNADEYSAAKGALTALVDSAPDGFLMQIESYGHAGYSAEYPAFQARIDLRLLAPTFKE